MDIRVNKMPRLIKEKIISCEWTGWCREYCKDRRIKQQIVVWDNGTKAIIEEGIPKDCIYSSNTKLEDEYDSLYLS